MQIDTILKFNPQSATLAANNIRLFWDGDRWCVNQGVRKVKTVFASNEFEPAFREWVRLAKQDIPPF